MLTTKKVRSTTVESVEQAQITNKLAMTSIAVRTNTIYGVRINGSAFWCKIVDYDIDRNVWGCEMFSADFATMQLISPEPVLKLDSVRTEELQQDLYRAINKNLIISQGFGVALGVA